MNNKRHWYALASFRNLQSVLFLMARAGHIARAMGSGAVLLNLSGEERERLEGFGEILNHTNMEPNAEELRAAMLPLENRGRSMDRLTPDMVKLMQRRVNGHPLDIDERKTLAKAIGCDQRDLMPDSVTEMLRELSTEPRTEQERRNEIERVMASPEVQKVIRDTVKTELLRRVYSEPSPETVPLQRINIKRAGTERERAGREIRADALEEARKMCVLRMVNWTESDTLRSLDYRDGIERACSDLACKLYGKVRELKR